MIHNRRVAATSLSFFLLVLVALLLVIPYLAELFLFPHLLADFDLTKNSIRISRLTQWTLQGALFLGDDAQRTLSIPHIELRYSLLDIFTGQANSLVIEGAGMDLTYEERQYDLTGLLSPAISVKW